jgi:hypothetical protein
MRNKNIIAYGHSRAAKPKDLPGVTRDNGGQTQAKSAPGGFKPGPTPAANGGADILALWLV